MQIESVIINPRTRRLLYLLLFMLFAFWPPVVFGFGVCFAVQMMLTISLFLSIGAKLNHKLLGLFVTLLLLHLLAILFGSSYFNLDLGNVITLTIALLVVSSIPFSLFAECYTKFMNFICLFSLCVFFLNILIPSVFSILPTVKATVEANNVIFALVPVEMGGYIRNFGMWGEPGMFGVYIILATVLELFYIKPLNKKHITVLIIALISTFSTAAYISFIVLLLVFLLSSKRISRKSKVLITLLSSVFFVGFAYYLINSTFNQAYVFQKLSETDSDEGTTFERIRAFETAWMLIKDYFPTGAGWGIYSKYLLKQDTILTVTPLNWFAIYGLFYGIIMNYGIYVGAKKIATSQIQALGIVIGILCVIISQEVSSVYIAVIPIFYVYAKSYKRKRIKYAS